MRMRIDQVMDAQALASRQRQVAVDQTDLGIDQRRGAAICATNEVRPAAAGAQLLKDHLDLAIREPPEPSPRRGDLNTADRSGPSIAARWPAARMPSARSHSATQLRRSGPVDLQPIVAVVYFLQNDVELPKFLDVAQDLGYGFGIEQPAAFDAVL